MSMAYSSFDGIQGHMLEIDHCGNVAQITLSNRFGETITAEFSMADTEEIAAAMGRLYRTLKIKSAAP